MYSIIRTLEYKNISETPFSGDVLDIGGSTKSGYHELMKGNRKITTVNINKEYGCDLVFDIQKPFPLKTGSFDVVSSFNVFEHIFGFHNAFSETSRVLKKGGKIVFAVPFLYQIHGSPDDYFRYTESALRELLAINGFKVEKITPLGYSMFSLIFQICGGIIPTIFLKKIIQSVCVFLDKVLLKISSKYRELASRIPLGYFVIGIKN
jgi:SAM-dependent methyltransferase